MYYLSNQPFGKLFGKVLYACEIFFARPTLDEPFGINFNSLTVNTDNVVN